MSLQCFTTFLSLDRLITTTVFSVRIFYFCHGTKFQISFRLAVEALSSKIYDFRQLFSPLVCFSAVKLRNKKALLVASAHFLFIVNKPHVLSLIVKHTVVAFTKFKSNYANK